MPREHIGLFVIGAGVVAVLAGFLIWAGVFKWFGHLPGDVRIESGKVRVYFPLASMLVVSVALSLVLHLVRRFLS
ncbi:MAG: DUF2905 domain-containing protein [Candidatus Krumholzibacteriia bacterium]